MLLTLGNCSSCVWGAKVQMGALKWELSGHSLQLVHSHLQFFTFVAFLGHKWPTNRQVKNRTSEPRPLDWTLLWALPWTPSWDVSWELSWESLAENREINPGGSCRGRSRGRTRGSTHGPTRGHTRGPTRGSRFAFACSVRRPTNVKEFPSQNDDVSNYVQLRTLSTHLRTLFTFSRRVHVSCLFREPAARLGQQQTDPLTMHPRPQDFTHAYHDPTTGKSLDIPKQQNHDKMSKMFENILKLSENCQQLLRRQSFDILWTCPLQQRTFPRTFRFREFLVGAL